jgi:hypothetical protein
LRRNGRGQGAYLRRHHFPVPSAATIMLGDNDLSGASTDTAARAEIVPMVANLRRLVQALHAAGVLSVGVVLQPPPSSQGALGHTHTPCTHTRTHTERERERQSDRQTDRHTDRQTDTHTHTERERERERR